MSHYPKKIVDGKQVNAHRAVWFDHGFCSNCGTDLNGDWIWDVGFSKYGNEEEADAYAEAYGAMKGFGRFGREIYVKSYDENGKKLTPFFKCPDCGEKCYEERE